MKQDCWMTMDDAVLLIFPGRNAGASLKREVAGWHRGAAHGIFPGRNAGASLKLSSDGEQVFDLQLIFPGRNAGASLKHNKAALRIISDRRSSPAEMPGPH